MPSVCTKWRLLTDLLLAYIQKGQLNCLKLSNELRVIPLNAKVDYAYRGHHYKKNEPGDLPHGWCGNDLILGGDSTSQESLKKTGRQSHISTCSYKVIFPIGSSRNRLKFHDIHASSELRCHNLPGSQQSLHGLFVRRHQLVHNSC